MADKDYMSTDEVATLLGVTAQTVGNMIRRGNFPNAYKIDPLARNSPYRIPRSDVEEFVEKHRPDLSQQNKKAQGVIAPWA